jgi:hypothetical protein
MIYVLIRKGSFLFLDIDTEYSQTYDIWYFNQSNILLNIDWQLENNVKRKRFVDYTYQAEKYDSRLYQIIKCIQGFGISDLKEMETEVVKYIFEVDEINAFI